MNWEKDERYKNVYTTSKIFDTYQYNVIISLEDETMSKSIKYWVSASSGKKRKEFTIFEEKEAKSLGGIKALFWIKEAILDFPSFYKNPYNKVEYICIAWADSRRRDIYERLKKEGFVFAMESGVKILRKKL
jgi:hypothetical protein